MLATAPLQRKVMIYVLVQTPWVLTFFCLFLFLLNRVASMSPGVLQVFAVRRICCISGEQQGVEVTWGRTQKAEELVAM